MTGVQTCALPIFRLPFDIAPKFLLLLVTAYSLTFGVYHFIVRPLPAVRFLFGMRPLAYPSREPRRVAAQNTVATLLILASVMTSEAAPSPVGRWYAEGGAAQVEVEPCGDTLCARVVWLRSPYDDNGCTLSDKHNPNPALRGRPMIGIDLLNGLQAVGDGTWDGGTIYDPTTGRSYRCMVSMDDENRLLVRGYIAFHVLGRTTTWIRVGTEDLRCEASRSYENNP